jgi:hypothetical protein
MSEMEDQQVGKDTKCYSYAVNMIVQVFAENEADAKAQLDEKGGYVTKREVILKDMIHLYKGGEA